VKACGRRIPSRGQRRVESDIQITPLEFPRYGGMIRKTQIGVREMDQQYFPDRLVRILGRQRCRRYEQRHGAGSEHAHH
jgi:hypothetical protein